MVGLVCIVESVQLLVESFWRAHRNRLLRLLCSCSALALLRALLNPTETVMPGSPLQAGAMLAKGTKSAAKGAKKVTQYLGKKGKQAWQGVKGLFE